MSGTADLLVGIAELLDDKGVGTWSATGAFTTGQTAIVLGVVPPTPDRCLTIDGPYVVVDDHGGPMMGHRLARVQIRARGLPRDPTDALDLDDAVFQVLHALAGVTLNGVRVGWVERVSAGVLGTDGDHRQERSANYEISLDAPTSHTF